MVANLRRAEQDLGKSCRILMDLAGPKLRTGPVAPGPRVLKWRPHRDPFGRVTEPARIWLMPADRPEPPPAPADACLPIRGRGLERLAVGDRLAFTDTREAARELEIVAVVGNCRWAEATETAYVAPGVRLRPESSRAGRRYRRGLRARTKSETTPLENRSSSCTRGTPSF